MADQLGGLIFGEFLVDNTFASVGTGFDTDGDGSANKSDDYIELQNATGSPISLNGFELWSTSGGQLFAFGPSDTVGSGQTATVVGEYTGTPPPGFFDAGGSGTSNFLHDGEGGGDTIFLVDTATGEFITFSYGSPPATPTPPPGFPGTSQVGMGEAIDSNAPNATAFTRDGNGDWIVSSPNPGTPGTVCIGSGAMVLTPDGERAVEDLDIGSELVTLSGETQEILWIARQEYVSDRHHFSERDCPVAIETPWQTNQSRLFLSRQHGVLVSVRSGTVTKFARAGHLATLRGGSVRLARGRAEMTYFNFLLQRHTAIFANGVAVESFLPGPEGEKTLAPLQRRTLRTQLRQRNLLNCYQTAFGYFAKSELPKTLQDANIITAEWKFEMAESLRQIS
ncbi:MAG: Hint domain-containing protein [Pseudomonadota bacterium]